MVRKEEFYYPSSSGVNDIHAARIIPHGEIKAILQIAHGMDDYFERYEEFARFLAENGILVTGNDHLGHGYTAKTKDDYGYFAKNDGNECVLRDMHRLTEITKEKYPGIPYFILGHSMGSFYTRQYLFTYPNEPDGAIIMGTGHMPYLMIKGGIFLAKTVSFFRGERYRSSLLYKTAFGAYNKKFGNRTPYEWLSRNRDNIEAYMADEKCTFFFTCNGYINMLSGMARLHSSDLISKMDKGLPVIFMSGEDDPVGDYRVGVLSAMQSFLDVGMKNVNCIFYPDDRHEILNEVDRGEVYKDILHWIMDILQEKQQKTN